MASKCTECGGNQLVWELGTELSFHAPLNGLLNMHDVIPVLYQSCNECSGTVEIVRDVAELTISG